MPNLIVVANVIAATISVNIPNDLITNSLEDF